MHNDQHSQPVFDPHPASPERRRDPLSLAVLVIAGLLLVFGGIAYFLLRPRPAPAAVASSARVHLTASTVEIEAPGAATWVPLTTDGSVAAGTHVRTGPEGRAEVYFADGSVLRLNANTEVALSTIEDAHTHSSSVDLVGGEVWNRIVNLGPQGDYSVQTPDALALVRGTAFSAKRAQSHFLLYGIQHSVNLRAKKSGAMVTVGASRFVDFDPAVGALLPSAQDAGFLQSQWRRRNLEADIAYLKTLRGDEAHAALLDAECLLDISQCTTKPEVREVRTTIDGMHVTAFVDLAAWDGRLLHLVWKRESTILRETDLTPKPGDLLAQDSFTADAAAAYTVEAQIDRIAVKSASFVVELSTEIPSSEPSSLPISSVAGVCRSYTATVSCGVNQIYLDRNKDCAFDSCLTCASTRAPKDTNSDGYADVCVLVASSAPVSSVSCADPGNCPNGTQTDSSGCRVCKPSVCGDGLIDYGEQCEPPNTRTCDSRCQKIAICQDPGTCQYGWDQAACVCNAPPTIVCGNYKIETGETCDPPNGSTCDSRCQIIQQTAPVCGNYKIEGNETCDPPNGSTCDQSCQIIRQTAPVCGNYKIETGEACDPPNGSTCDSRCQTIQQTAPVCGNFKIETGETCDPPNGSTCDSRCQTIQQPTYSYVPPPSTCGPPPTGCQFGTIRDANGCTVCSLG